MREFSCQVKISNLNFWGDGSYKTHLKFIRVDRGAPPNEQGLTRGQKLSCERIETKALILVDDCRR
jgi:hypothetical protein